MPPGYTEKIYSNEKQSFEEFALWCARSIGYCFHLRDDPLENGLSLKTLDIDYYKGRINELKCDLHKSLPDFKKNIILEIKSMETSIKEKTLLKRRYDRMLRKCKSWVPPTDNHLSLKQFMIEQLTSSIDHDCNIKYYKQEINKLSGILNDKSKLKLKYKEHKDFIQKMIVEYELEIQKEVNHTLCANEWITQLANNLNFKIIN